MDHFIELVLLSCLKLYLLFLIVDLLLACIVVQRHVIVHSSWFQDWLRILSKISFANLILICINDTATNVHLLRPIFHRHFDVLIHFFEPSFTHLTVSRFLHLLLALIRKRNIGSRNSFHILLLGIILCFDRVVTSLRVFGRILSFFFSYGFDLISEVCLWMSHNLITILRFVSSNNRLISHVCTEDLLIKEQLLGPFGLSIISNKLL